MTASSLSKAVIINMETDEHIACLFNPTEYTFAKTNTWKAGKRSGGNVPKLEFDNGAPTTLSMQLFFDSYAEKKDVRKAHTDAIWALMMVDDSLKDKKNKKGRPPRVRFQWGAAWYFEAVLMSINQRFTLFLPDGTPVRATLDAQFQQIKDEKLYPRQNPTSGGVGGERVWTVREGETLSWIAYKEYGDAAQWRPIAEANRLSRVRDLKPGTMLMIPTI